MTSNRDSADVSVLFGSGDGTFSAPLLLGVLASPVRVALGDMDGDGALDIVVLNAASGDFGFIRGHGDGTFDPVVNISVGLGLDLGGVAVADYDGNGTLDLALVNAGTDEDILVLDGNGAGAFTAAGTYVIGLGPQENAIACGDLDGDGKIDLVATGRNDFQVHVLLNVTP